jgi:cobalt-zinc-cadmium efflux system outer membrane protein
LTASVSTPARDAETMPADPALSALIAQVLRSNPRVAAARAAVDAARARERAADRPLFNPELELDAESADTSTASVGISQTIDWSDKRGSHRALAGFEREAAEAELARIRLSLGTGLLSALADHRSARELDRLAQRRIEIMGRFAALAERRRKAGDLGQVDLDLARLAATQARLQRAQAAAALADARAALAAVLGGLRPKLPALDTRLPDLDPRGLDHEPLLEGLPGLRLQRARINVRRSAVELRARERRADPTLGLRAIRDSANNGAGITLSVPLLVRNDFRAEVDAANADLIEAQQQGQDAYRRAKARLSSAATRYRLMRDAWRDWEQTGQASLENQIDLLQRIWQAGEMDTTDYLVQLKQTLDTRASALKLRGRLWRAWSDWLAASAQLEAWLGLGR